MTLVAKCCALTFNIPSFKGLHPSLSKVLDLTKGVAASSTGKKQYSKQVELVATGITLLGGGERDTVIHKLLQHLEHNNILLSTKLNPSIALNRKDEDNVTYAQNSSHTQEQSTCVDGCSFFSEISGGVSPLHQGSLLLESYAEDSQRTSQQFKPMAITPNSHNPLQLYVDGCSNQISKPRISLQQSSIPPRTNLQQSSIPPRKNLQQSSTPPRTNLQQSSIPPRTNLQQSSIPPRTNLQQSSIPPRTNLQQSNIPPQTESSSVCYNSTSSYCEGENHECCEYLTELIKNNKLIKELESDWESSQVELKQREFELSKRCLCSNTSIPTPSNSPSLSQYSYSYSEDVLKELQEPFSQSREPSPLCVPVTKTLKDMSNHPLCTETGYTDTPGSISEQSITASMDGSPELFSSVSSHASSLHWRRSGLRTGVTPTQSQLLFDKRLSTSGSPELFGSDSMPSKSSHRNSVSQSVTLCHSWLQSSMAYKTPALPSRMRSHIPRRKLVQNVNSVTCKGESQPLSSDCSPLEHTRSGRTGLLNNGYYMYNSSPDLF